MQPHRQQPPPNYPQQHWGPPAPQHGPPQARPPKRQTSPAILVLAVIGGVLGLLLLFGGAVTVLGSEEETPTASSSPGSVASAAAAAGIPPEPDQKTWAAYIADLKKIDLAIVDDEEQAVDRGRNQCSSIKDFPADEAKLVDLTNQRFTAPGHPDGFGKAKATKILAAVRKHLCPTY